MMSFNLRPDQVAEELNEFNEKVANGLQNMLEIGEISEGVSEREAVFSDDKVTLYRYKAPENVSQNSVPMLIVYALVNRPYMTDLQENRSIIKGLLDAGQDVYLIDWGYPDRSDRFLTLDD